MIPLATSATTSSFSARSRLQEWWKWIRRRWFCARALVVSACMRVTDFAKAGQSRRARVKRSEVKVGGVACFLSVRALCLHSHETSLHTSACDGLDQSGEVLLAEHLSARTMAVYTYFPMAWSKEQLLVSLCEPSHPILSENASQRCSVDPTGCISLKRTGSMFAHQDQFFGIKLIIHVLYLHIHSKFQACNLKPSQSQSSHQPSHRPPHSQRQPSSSRSQSPSRRP
jgi:hypothetical protein